MNSIYFFQFLQLCLFTKVMNIMVTDSLSDSDSLEGADFLNNTAFWPLIRLYLNMCVRCCVDDVNFVQYL